jgi:pimeloyl-ACP methyl ester carboxylesterase
MGLLAGRVDGDAVDLPGFGHSAPPDDRRYTIGAHARAVVRLLEHERRGPVHLFGNSLGGAVATRLAADRPTWSGPSPWCRPPCRTCARSRAPTPGSRCAAWLQLSRSR